MRRSHLLLVLALACTPACGPADEDAEDTAADEGDLPPEGLLVEHHGTFSHLTAVGDVVFWRGALTGTDPAGPELWRSDGTVAGTTLVKDINPGESDSDISGIVDLAGVALFLADDGTSGLELWRSDGTEAGTTLVLDINPGPADGVRSGGPIAAHDGLVYFGADDGVHGFELWRSDGTAAGTSLVVDADLSPSGSLAASSLVSFAGALYFSAAPFGPPEVWRVEGDTATRVDSVSGAKIPSTLAYLGAAGPHLYLVAETGPEGQALWRTDGTILELVADINPGPAGADLGAVADGGGLALFPASDGLAGRELWRTDGTAAGTTLVLDTVPGEVSGVLSQGPPHVLAGALLFPAEHDGMSTTGVPHGHLWRSDGTPDGTVRLSDVYIEEATLLGDHLYFRGDDGERGPELWRTDGTAEGTERVLDLVFGPRGSAPSSLTVAGGRLFFYTADEALHVHEP